jgi:hypothetical protein
MTPPVVVSYGMGTDSTALLLRWICEPATRPCDLANLLVVTAQTGDEWPITGELVTRHMLPLFRQHHIRWAEVARRGPRQADGITVLSDSRTPTAVHLTGAYRLLQEMMAAGTVPQAGGARKCSAKAKGWPLDQFIRQETRGEPYVHAVGFEAGEASRAVRDATFNTATRTGIYPLKPVVRSSSPLGAGLRISAQRPGLLGCVDPGLAHGTAGDPRNLHPG